MKISRWAARGKRTILKIDYHCGQDQLSIDNRTTRPQPISANTPLSGRADDFTIISGMTFFLKPIPLAMKRDGHRLMDEITIVSDNTRSTSVSAGLWEKVSANGEAKKARIKAIHLSPRQHKGRVGGLFYIVPTKIRAELKPNSLNNSNTRWPTRHRATRPKSAGIRAGAPKSTCATAPAFRPMVARATQNRLKPTSLLRLIPSPVIRCSNDERQSLLLDAHQYKIAPKHGGPTLANHVISPRRRRLRHKGG